MSRHEHPDDDHDRTNEDAPPSDPAGRLRSLLLDSPALDSVPDPLPLIDGVLYADSLAWLWGRPGSGKSFVALDWAGSVASGLPWQGHETTRGPVLYLVAEGGGGLRRRVRAWETNTRQPMTGVWFLPEAVQLLNTGPRLELVALVAELRPLLIVIDTQARVTVGAEENSNGEMGRLVAAADQLRQASGACVLMVHHGDKAGNDLRGASALDGAATTVIRATKDGPHIRLDCRKQKDAEDFPALLLRLDPVAESAVIRVSRSCETSTGSEAEILALLRDAFEATGASVTQLKESCDLSRATLYRAVNALLKRGAIRNIGSERAPRYLPADGV
ncbi:AAA family ATPase [Streptomyces sp. NPDC048696]|uniref:AAA family ATPase n=1 Tax=Streptomyces sp. NPDC048696 TaxID=3365585 RepID=UPI003724581F